MKIILTLILPFMGLIVAAQVKVTSGKIQHIENFQSKYVEPRNIDVWLPDNYSNKEKYAVLYMHDGQMLFDAQSTWNKQAWEIDEAAGKLIAENKTKKFIVVGIFSIASIRHSEYFPEKPYNNLTAKQKENIKNKIFEEQNTAFSPTSDNYLKFLVSELKPYIDKNFSTKTNAANTFIAGSSMGGLISIYAMCEYPKVFSGAACLSSHWPGTHQVENNPIPDAFLSYLEHHLPKPKHHKIYFDYGDKTLDALYPPLQKRVDSVMVKKGYSEKNWVTKFFPGKDHSENAWRERMPIPLLFLLGK